MTGGLTSSKSRSSKCRSCMDLQQHMHDHDHTTTKSSDYGELEPSALLFLGSSPTSVLLDGGDTSGSPPPPPTTTACPPPERLPLPRRGTEPCSLDRYLSSIPSVASRTHEWFHQQLEQDEQEEEDDESVRCMHEVCMQQGHCHHVGQEPSCQEEHLFSNNATTTTTTTTTTTSTTNNNNNNQNTVDPPYWMTAQDKRCLNVLQGEVAHATPSQTDWVVSAEATTCHVVALRSTTATTTTTNNNNNNNNNNKEPLTSLAHIDQPADVYAACLERMLVQHIYHHTNHTKQHNVPEHNGQEEQAVDEPYGFFMDDEEPPNNDTSTTSLRESFLPTPDFEDDSTSCNTNHHNHHDFPILDDKIHIDLHMVGGYMDAEGTSAAISTSLIHHFNDLAQKYQHQITLCLQTAAIGALNTTTTCTQTTTYRGLHQPIGRGLAMDTHTGAVHPVTRALPPSLDGPALELRSARFWAHHTMMQQPNRNHSHPAAALAVIHDTTTAQGHIIIEPFAWRCHVPQLEALAAAPDEVLLHAISTSPECESDRFVHDVRRTLHLLTRVDSTQVFGNTKTMTCGKPQQHHQSCGNLQQQECNLDTTTISKPKPLVYSRSTLALNQWEPVE